MLVSAEVEGEAEEGEEEGEAEGGVVGAAETEAEGVADWLLAEAVNRLLSCSSAFNIFSCIWLVATLIAAACTAVCAFAVACAVALAVGEDLAAKAVRRKALKFTCVERSTSPGSERM